MHTAIAHFQSVAPRYMARFMIDFATYKVDDLDAAAVFGNFGTESLGLTVLQEIHPVVRGSRGGYGWPQWTGKRRVQYETWCKNLKFDPAADDSNYNYVKVELNGEYRVCLVRLKAAHGLHDKVAAFERFFEGAGVVNLNSRISWANVALEAFHNRPKQTIISAG